MSNWDALGGIPLIALDVAGKATGLLGVAVVVHLLAGPRRPLVRSTLWNACLVGLILIPASSVLFPRLRLPVLAARPTGVMFESVRSTPPMATFSDDLVDRAPVVESDSMSLPRVEPVEPRISVEPPVAPTRFDPSPVALGAYLGIVGFLLVRLGFSLRAVNRLRRGAGRVDDPAWRDAAERWRVRLGIERRVAVVQADRVSVPVVVGWLRPTVILPAGLIPEASPELVDAVLLHELCHIRRGDYGWNLVRKLVQAVYWPHPLTWPLARLIGTVREQACDDLCVHVMGGPAVYRASLLAVASGLVRRPETALGLAMARTSHLARRLAWIDRTPGSAACLLRWPARLAMLVGVAALAGVLGSIELAHAQAPANLRDELKPIEPRQVQAAPLVDPPAAIEVEVLAHDTGKPLAGATVRFGFDMDHVARTTDGDGKIRFDLTARAVPESLSVEAVAEGYVQQRHFFSEVNARHAKIPAQFTVRLRPGTVTLGGTVTNRANQPIAGVKVAIWGYLNATEDPHEVIWRVVATTDEQGHWRSRCFRELKCVRLTLTHPDYVDDARYNTRWYGRTRPADPFRIEGLPLDRLRDFTAVDVMKSGVELKGRVVDRAGNPIPGAEVGWLEVSDVGTNHDGMPTTRTDPAGAFRVAHVEPRTLMVQVKARGFAPEIKQVVARAGAEPLEIMLGPPRRIAGQVVDSQGKPIPSVFIGVSDFRGHQSLGVYRSTDAEGRFHWDDAPAETIPLYASRAGFHHGQFQVQPGAAELRWTLRRALHVEGSIRDAVTGNLITAAQVQVGVRDPNSDAIRWHPDEYTFEALGRFKTDLDAEAAPEYRLRITAGFYEPFETRAFRADEGEVTSDVKLIKSDQPEGVALAGIVRRPDGQPLAGAEVVVAYPPVWRNGWPTVSVRDGKLSLAHDQASTTTDAKGRFRLPLHREANPARQYDGLVVTHPDFFAAVTRTAFEADPSISVKPWGRVKGIARVGRRPASGTSIAYLSNRIGPPTLTDASDATTDAEGQFVLDRVVPGDGRVSLRPGTPTRPLGISNGTLVETRAGETARVEVGGKGRPVVARIAIPGGFNPKADYTAYSEFEIESDRPSLPYPRELLDRRDGSKEGWVKDWWASVAGHEYRRNWFRLDRAKLQPDGSIRADDVPPGEYRLKLTFVADPFYASRTAFATKQFTIPPIPEGQSDEPFDLGTLHPEPK